jgi:hypothetical protein
MEKFALIVGSAVLVVVIPLQAAERAMEQRQAIPLMDVSVSMTTEVQQ